MSVGPAGRTPPHKRSLADTLRVLGLGFRALL